MRSKLNDQLLKAGASARSNPYLMRVLQDKELRDNAITALASARAAYDRVSSGKSANKLLDDKKLKKELKHTQSALVDIRDSLSAAPKKKKGMRRLLAISLIGGAVALATNEGLRSKVLDKLFGAEEEFEYTSTTTNNSTNGTSQATPSQPTQAS